MRENRQELRREQFSDGSAIVTYADGSALIMESKLARTSVMREGRPVNYNDPPPSPPSQKPDRRNFGQAIEGEYD